MNYKSWKVIMSAAFWATFLTSATINPYGFLRTDHTIFSTAIANSGTVQMVGELSISNNWIRATPPAAKVAAGFLAITNKGKQNDKLLAVKFVGAEKSRIHEIRMQDGVMKMRQLDGGVEIPAGETVTLKPGGSHLMFIGLKTRLESGQSLPVKLIFSRAGEITLNFPVLAMKKHDGMMKKGKEIMDGAMKKGKDMLKMGKEMMTPDK